MSYQHKNTALQQGYSSKFASVYRSLSLVVLYFLSNLLTVPISIQDMVMHCVMTIVGGYTILIHLQLYIIYPVLIVVPTLAIGAIIHFVFKAVDGQSRVEKQQLMQKILQSPGDKPVEKASSFQSGEDESAVQLAIAEESESLSKSTPYKSNLVGFSENKVDGVVVSTVAGIISSGRVEQRKGDLLKLYDNRDRRQSVQFGIKLAAMIDIECERIHECATEYGQDLADEDINSNENDFDLDDDWDYLLSENSSSPSFYESMNHSPIVERVESSTSLDIFDLQESTPLHLQNPTYDGSMEMEKRIDEEDILEEGSDMSNRDFVFTPTWSSDDEGTFSSSPACRSSACTHLQSIKENLIRATEEATK